MDTAQRKLCAAFSIFAKLKNKTASLLHVLWNRVLLPLGYSIGAAWIVIGSIMLKIAHLLSHVQQMLLVRRPRAAVAEVGVESKRMQ